MLNEWWLKSNQMNAVGYVWRRRVVEMRHNNVTKKKKIREMRGGGGEGVGGKSVLDD